MRKLRLDVDALHVESFSVNDPVPSGGTVRARLGDGDLSITLPPDDSANAFCYTATTCIGPTYCCPPTWRPTCANTCENTCPPSCAWYCSVLPLNTCVSCAGTCDGSPTCDDSGCICPG